MTLTEAKAIIKIIESAEDKINMINPILDLVEHAAEAVTGIKESAPDPVKAATVTKKKRIYKFKQKKCEMCGKEFAPHYGAQKICDVCKDIKDTASDLIGAGVD
jgi:hypothetical protein